MTDDDKSDAEILQEILPGSSTFPARLLCPKCGWHFKRGLTDPSGEHSEVMPDMALVCGQCLALLVTNAQRQAEPMTTEKLAAMTPDELAGLQRVWMVSCLTRELCGPDADAQPPGKPQ